ncbi:MAG: hypothetical protein E7117_08975 [Bacteroidales bacterium]|nr:hypothetical protein [Bacteroidales bacterium]
MKTRTKIIWICIGYLIFGAFAVDRILMFINGNIDTHKLIIGLVTCISLIYLLAYNHHRLLKENKEE